MEVYEERLSSSLLLINDIVEYSSTTNCLLYGCKLLRSEFIKLRTSPKILINVVIEGSIQYLMNVF